MSFHTRGEAQTLWDLGDDQRVSLTLPFLHEQSQVSLDAYLPSATAAVDI